jgi:hypothetical protein
MKYTNLSTPANRLKYVRICLNNLLGHLPEQRKSTVNKTLFHPQPNLPGSNLCTSKSFFFTLNELKAIKVLSCVGCGHIDSTQNLQYVIGIEAVIPTYTPICTPCYQKRF